MRRLIPIAFFLVPLLLTACGGGGSGGGPDPDPGDDCESGGGPVVTVTGTILYQRLVLTPTGLGPSTELRPARFVDVAVRPAGGGTCFGKGSTDATGAYSINADPPAASQVEVVVYSRTDNDPLRRVTAHDALPPGGDSHTNTNVFSHTSPAFAAGSPGTVDFTVPYNPGGADRPSIGFGCLDVLLTCAEEVRAALGSVPPKLHVYTQLGNNGAIGVSHYSTGNNAIAIMGGAAGNLDNSDTDYFDDPVVAHEFHHFVEFNLAHSLTRGGSHGGEALEPGFAWSEGHSTGLGNLCLKSPFYVDSFDTTGGPAGGWNVENIISQVPQVRGIGSELSIVEIVWDLGDGAGGIPQTDGDVATVSLTDLYGALLTFDSDTDAPCIGLFLDRLVSRGAITEGDVTILMGAPENQQITYPLTGDDVWPIPLATPGVASGSVDTTGGKNCRGYDASRWYGFTLTSTRTLTFDLAIGGSGTGRDLDLYLLAMSGGVIASSTSGGSTDESISNRTLGPGNYMVRVEAACGGAGNQASFTLTVTD